MPRGALDERELDRLPAIVAEACDAVARRRAAELDGFELRTQDARKVDVLPPRIGFAFSAQAVDDLESGDVDLPEADLDAALARRFSNTSEGSNGKYHIALIPSLDGDSKWRVYAGTRRTLLTYLPRTLPGPHLDVFSDAAVSVVTGIFLSELYHLRKSVSDETAREKDVLRTAKYARSYVATFSLLNAAPDEVLVSWQIQDAIEGSL